MPALEKLPPKRHIRVATENRNGLEVTSVLNEFLGSYHFMFVLGFYALGSTILEILPLKDPNWGCHINRK